MPFLTFNRRHQSNEGTFCELHSLSLHFNGHFFRWTGGPVLAGTRMSPYWILLELGIMEVVVTAGIIRCVKLQSNCCQQQNNTQLCTCQMPFLSPNSVRALKGKLCQLILPKEMENYNWNGAICLLKTSHQPTLQESSCSVTPTENGQAGLVTLSSYRRWMLVMVSSRFLTTLVKSFSAKLSFFTSSTTSAEQFKWQCPSCHLVNGVKALKK